MNEPGFSVLNCSARLRGVPLFVSNIDSDLLGRSWYLNSGYARGMGDRYMHRIIMARTGIEPDIVDHINGDRFDNRRENLRSAGCAGNSRNQTRRSKGHSSRFKGVYWAEWAGKWRAQITVDRRAIKLGYFASEEAAQEAYALASKHYFGEYAAPYVESSP